MMSQCALLDTFLPATFAWTLLLATTFLYVWYPYRLLYLSQCPWILAAQAVVLFYVLVNFGLTTFRDPGIIPRPSEDEERSYGYLPPAFREETINGIVVRLKWCTTCKFYRPPRCSHCSVCNRCIEMFDHHCPWVNNCIGRRNYRHFFCFLVSLSVHTAALLALSVHYALLLPLDRDRLAEPEPTATMALIVVAALLAPTIVCLTCSHVLLILYGRTTNEQVTGKFKGGHNPFRRRHPCSDWCYKLCGPQYPSYNKKRTALCNEAW